MNCTGISSRDVYDEGDFWLVREFLVRTLAVAPMGHNWDVRRWDGQYFYNPSGCWEDGWERHVRLWIDDTGGLVGCVSRDGLGGAAIQVHPAYRGLEPEMVAWAEAELCAPDDAGSTLEFVVFEYDVLRQRLLAERGYTKMSYGGMFRHMTLPVQRLPPVDLPAPYLLRSVQPEDDADCQRIADLLNAAFKRTFHNGPEYQSFARRAPCYVNDLDLVAVAPDGGFAAYVAMPYDPVNRRGIFEPVCTHPGHLRKGLASALMREALCRVQTLGARDVIVDTGDMIPANALYDALGFTEAYKAHAWRRTWQLTDAG